MSLTDAEVYELKDEARKAAREIYKHGPQWTGHIASNIEAFADGAAWYAALSYQEPPNSARRKQRKAAGAADHR